MSKDDVGEGAVTFGLGIIVALLLALSCIFMCGGCCTARVARYEDRTEVYGRIQETQKTTFPDGRVEERTVDTTSGNVMDTTQTLLSSVLSTLSGVANKMGLTVGQ